MLSLCDICHDTFNKRYYTDIKNIQYMPRVCSSECFEKLIKDTVAGIRYKPSKVNFSVLRSDYERGFGLWLTKRKIYWQYEPFSIRIGKYKYIPDFFLPFYRLIFEVKGLWEPGAYAKFKRIYEGYAENKIYLIDGGFMKHINCKPLKLEEVYGCETK